MVSPSEFLFSHSSTHAEVTKTDYLKKTRNWYREAKTGITWISSIHSGEA